MIKSQYTFLNRDTSTSPWIQSNLELWEQVLDARDILCIPEKQTVFWQGDPAAAVYVVQRGRIILTISNRRGEEKVLMYAGKGCIIGEQALEKGEMYSYSAMTMEESCFYRVKAEVFLEYLNSRKDVVMALILNQMDKSKALTSHIADLSFDSAKNRLVRELLYCAEQYGVRHEGEVHLKYALNQEDMGKRILASRVTVNKILKELEQDGLIVRNGRKLILKDIQALEQLLIEEEKR